MNLARIEYYFAEFLSIMEMPNVNEWKIDIVPDVWDTDPAKIIDGKILVPQNVWFVGTANRDDSTYTITDKVYDRAISIEMNHRAPYIDAPYTEQIDMTYDYFAELCAKGIENNPVSNKSLEKLSKLDDFVADKFKITFGNRILTQIMNIVPVFMACGGKKEDALDFLLSRKVISKIEGRFEDYVKGALKELVLLMEKTYGAGVLKRSEKTATSIMKRL
jgi:hypothetical protein